MKTPANLLKSQGHDILTGNVTKSRFVLARPARWCHKSAAMIQEVDDYIEEYRAFMRSLGYPLADQLTDEYATALRGMYLEGSGDADAIERYDAFLEIIRRKIPFKEKLAAVEHNMRRTK